MKLSVARSQEELPRPEAEPQGTGIAPELPTKREQSDSARIRNDSDISTSRYDLQKFILRHIVHDMRCRFPSRCCCCRPGNQAMA